MLTKIEELLKEYNKLKYIEEQQNGYSAQFHFYDELKDFFKSVKKVGDQLKGYGNNIKIDLRIMNGAGKMADFVLRLSPYQIDKNPDDYLVGYWKEDEKDKAYVLYSFNPNFSSEPYTNNSKQLYIDPLSFVFLQLYENKEYIVNKFEDQAIEDLTDRIKFTNRLIEISDKIDT